MTTPSTSKDVEQKAFSFIAVGDAKWCSKFGRHVVVSYETKHSYDTIRNHEP